MLEFNNWFFVLMIQFFVLMFILNAILFKPMIELFSQREQMIKGALEEAQIMNEKKEKAIAQMNADLANAKAQAKQIINSLREEALAYQREVISSAEKEAVQMIEKARAEIKAETERVRVMLRQEVERLSDEIVNKLIKV
ncbi:MAG: F0F1 ATP synthase subunit B [Thermodesulfovibrio sp.]|jgi:F-type H+-transporting ATPase subunit b|uniref:F0F1 ATP synthase subunit B n=1 Tax=unclassified Thermodesulfovibrio TaxID=2645936 RepID=UPI00083AD1BC|nr:MULTISPECIES: F0F1 ATP synthase subunit B [unclassified Thermodesulfovibrio]MDI1472015.1 F0F1 ATP synthase subunit B [Thermodesulfovibrio sp. 1176]MDI6715192.1 F0F1 ATP synthase subunit B [Thermodesulfovibrio sp.]ODA45228.1 ATP synthase F0 sector subunit b' [Thermodesulfovibrio sp. N1]